MRRLFGSLRLDYGFAFIETAYRAYAVRHFQCMALRALYEAGYSQFPICASLVATGFRMFTLRGWHLLHLLTDHRTSADEYYGSAAPPDCSERIYQLHHYNWRAGFCQGIPRPGTPPKEKARPGDRVFLFYCSAASGRFSVAATTSTTLRPSRFFFFSMKR